MSIAVSIKSDTASPYLRNLVQNLSPQKFAAAVGPACTRVLQTYLRQKGPNRRGWPTTNFWPRAAKATSWTQTGDGVKISINQIGVRQRYLGGHIAPVKAKALTIPISPISYGKVASDFPDLVLIQTTKGAYLIQYASGGGTKDSGGNKRMIRNGRPVKTRLDATRTFLFKLVSSVDQAPDPGVLPSDHEFVAAVDELLKKALQR